MQLKQPKTAPYQPRGAIPECCREHVRSGRLYVGVSFEASMRDARNACLGQSSGEGRGGSGLRGGLGCLTLFGRSCNVVFSSAILMSGGMGAMEDVVRAESVVHARISSDGSLGVSATATTMRSA